MGKVAAGQGTAVWRGTETKTRYCQPLRHRNRHPPRETLNHFYCIELSLLPAERTSKRAPSLSRRLSLSPSSLSLPPAPFARSFPALVLRRSSPSCRLRSLSPFAPLRPLPRRPGDNTNAKAFTPLWLPKWNKFFNSRIYRRASESPALSPR